MHSNDAINFRIYEVAFREKETKINFRLCCVGISSQYVMKSTPQKFRWNGIFQQSEHCESLLDEISSQQFSFTVTIELCQRNSR